MNDVLKEFEQTALMGAKAVREFLTYQGDNKMYLNHAKVGAVAMSSYSKLRGTVNAEKQLQLIQQRLLKETDGNVTVRALPDIV